MKNPKIFTNKSPWGMKAHGNMCTQPIPCEQAQAKNISRRQRRVGKQPLFIRNQKEQLGTYTREPSLWEWTKGCPINFLPPFTWREQCPRAVISAEVKRTKGLHHLPQDCTFSERGVETKLQQIGDINVKNIQDMIHVPSPWILKGKNWEHMVWRV